MSTIFFQGRSSSSIVVFGFCRSIFPIASSFGNYDSVNDYTTFLDYANCQTTGSCNSKFASRTFSLPWRNTSMHCTNAAIDRGRILLGVLSIICARYVVSDLIPFLETDLVNQGTGLFSSPLMALAMQGFWGIILLISGVLHVLRKSFSFQTNRGVVLCAILLPPLQARLGIIEIIIDDGAFEYVSLIAFCTLTTLACFLLYRNRIVSGCILLLVTILGSYSIFETFAQ